MSQLAYEEDFSCTKQLNFSVYDVDGNQPTITITDTSLYNAEVTLVDDDGYTYNYKLNLTSIDNLNGTENITITATDPSDGQDLSDSQTYQINIVSVVDPPNLESDTLEQSTTEWDGSILNLDGLSTIPINEVGIVEGGQTLTWSINTS